MKSRLIVDYYYRLNILALSCFSPATLFHKINALLWYLGTLRTWSDSFGYQTGSMGKLMMRPDGVFSVGARETVEMIYEFEKPFILDSSKFERTFDEPALAHREAIRLIAELILFNFL